MWICEILPPKIQCYFRHDIVLLTVVVDVCGFVFHCRRRKRSLDTEESLTSCSENGDGENGEVGDGENGEVGDVENKDKDLEEGDQNKTVSLLK